MHSKTAPLSIKNFELYSILKKSNSFKDFPDLPENVTEHYVGSELEYTSAETDKFTLKIMADGEFRFIMKSAVTFVEQTYYIRFPNKTVFGYAMNKRKMSVSGYCISS